MDRKREIAAAVEDIRAIEKRDGVTRESLEKIKLRLIRLAARQDLFPESDFPPPAPGGKLKSCLYRVAGEPRENQAADRTWRVFPAHGDIREAR